MSKYITIDGGTTNTRISLVIDRKIVSVKKLNIGARASIDGNEPLKNGIKQAVAELLVSNRLSETDIERILASGMITSEFGLCNLPHINVPAGLMELHNSVYETKIEEISSIPFVFVRGVKLMGKGVEDTDIMRGEETEIMGILNSEYGSCIYVLPGSHSKVIKTDADGKITDFATMLTGEMIDSLYQNTILRDALDFNNSKSDGEYLLKGFDCCVESGINKALFKVRVLKNIFGCNKDQIYSFFLGVVLCEEILKIMKEDVKIVVLGGKAQIKNAMAEILRKRDNKEVIVLDSETVDMSTTLGVIRVFEGRM